MAIGALVLRRLLESWKLRDSFQKFRYVSSGIADVERFVLCCTFRAAARGVILCPRCYLILWNALATEYIT